MSILIVLGKSSIAVYVWNILIVFLRFSDKILFLIGYDNEKILTTAAFCQSMLVFYVFPKWTYNIYPILYGLK